MAGQTGRHGDAVSPPRALGCGARATWRAAPRRRPDTAVFVPNRSHRRPPAAAPWRLARALRLPGSEGAILCLHGIDTAREPSEGAAAVSVERLGALLDVLGGVADVVPLRELLARRRAGRPTRGLAALTFDDAYRSLDDAIARVLRPRGVPATVFVVSSASRVGAAFWWDRVDDLAPHVPPERWRRFEDEIGLPQSYRDGQPAAYGPLRPLRQWVLRAHVGRWPARAEAPLAALESEAGRRTVQRAMTYPELAAMVADGLVDVGVHTITHPVLPLLDDDELRREVRDGHAELLAHLPPATVLPVLAIPFGLGDERTARIAAQGGMWCSLTLGDRTIAFGHRAAIPRFSVSRNLSPARLGLRVLGIEGGARRALGVAPAMYPPLPSETT